MPRIVDTTPVRSIYKEAYEFIDGLVPGETALFVKGEDFNTLAHNFNMSVRNYLATKKIRAETHVRGDEVYVKRNG